jgi:adenylate cyclase
VLLARTVRALREWRGAAIRVTYPNGRSVRVPTGFSVLEASRSAKVPHACICGGRGRCSTCRIRIVVGASFFPPPSMGELAVLQRIGAAPLVRLACQARPTGNVSVVPLLPANWPVTALRRREWPLPGQERFIVVLTVDMRDSTRLAETRLPFDAVFIVDRFVTSVGAALTASSGRISHFLGDGLMATFGLECEPRDACYQALSALVTIGRNVEALNGVLQAETGEKIRYGVGVHCGSAVVGEIGEGAMRTFTTLGDAANVAARLEALCKEFRCEAVISHDVWKTAGFSMVRLPEREASLRGRNAKLLVHPVERVEQLAAFVAVQAVHENHQLP